MMKYKERNKKTREPRIYVFALARNEKKVDIVWYRTTCERENSVEIRNSAPIFSRLQFIQCKRVMMKYGARPPMSRIPVNDSDGCSKSRGAACMEIVIGRRRKNEIKERLSGHANSAKL